MCIRTAHTHTHTHTHTATKLNIIPVKEIEAIIAVVTIVVLVAVNLFIFSPVLAVLLSGRLYTFAPSSVKTQLQQFDSFHNDREGCPRALAEVLLYVHRNRRLIKDGSPGRPPRLSHSSILTSEPQGRHRADRFQSVHGGRTESF